MTDFYAMPELMSTMEYDEQALMGIFGKNAKIEKQGPENEFIVSTVLDSGITRGGQKAKFTLIPEKNIQGMEDLPESDNVFRLKKTVICDKDLTSELPNCYFVPRYITSNRLLLLNDPSAAMDWQTLEAHSLNPENTPFSMHKFLQIGTFADATSEDSPRRIVVMRVFTNSDDLTVLLHEGGHTKGGEIQEKAGKSGSIFHKIVSEMKIHENWTISKFAVDIWKRVVRGEVQANARIIELVSKLKKEGNDISPGEDVELFGIKKFIQLQLQPYIDVCNKRFSKSVSSEEIEELFRV